MTIKRCEKQLNGVIKGYFGRHLTLSMAIGALGWNLFFFFFGNIFLFI